MPIIEAKNLFFRYAAAEKYAIRNVSLSIRRGEFVLLTGPSGCGKTTLCRCFNGLIPHFHRGVFEGEVWVCGYSVAETPPNKLSKHVGLVFQNPENQLFCLSVEKDVAFGLENMGLPEAEIRRRVEWALRVTGIEELRHRAPHELSGGQQQKAAIASVLAMEPEVVVLDEPTSFLDPRSALELFDLLKRINEDLGVTIVLVEHRLDLCASIAQRVLAMVDGELALDGSPAEVLCGEAIRLFGVGVPKSIRLYQLLLEAGVELEHPPLSAEELADLVRQKICQ